MEGGGKGWDGVKGAIVRGRERVVRERLVDGDGELETVREM